ncbi:MAG TPA: hypothetical protein V6C81_14115 [Planktothrix sp.]|jgi:hypothetical protein
MNSKSVALGVTVAAACAAPAFAQSPTHILASGFYCAPPINTFFQDGGFTKWNHSAHHNPATFFTFEGDQDDEFSIVGLRLDAANTKAGTVKFNYDISNSNDPHLGVMLTLQSVGFQAGVRFDYIGEVDWSEFGLFTGTKFGNFIFTPASNSFFTLPKGVKYENLWIYDITWPYNGGDGLQTIENVTVNGVAVVPNTGNATLYDCTPEGLIKIPRGSL